ncbi:unnamed protein product, partial [Rotaria sordida]
MTKREKQNEHNDLEEQSIFYASKQLRHPSATSTKHLVLYINSIDMIFGVLSIVACLSLVHVANPFVTNISYVANNGTQSRLMVTNLATILRNAGLKVVEVSGWTTRGHGQMTSVKSIIVHHTAGPASGDMPSLNFIRDGSSSLRGPLSQLALGRTGTWYVVAAGLCYHAGVVTDSSLYSNANAIGIEAEGTGVPASNVGHAHWPEVQWQSYVRVFEHSRMLLIFCNSSVKRYKEIASLLG